MNFYKKSESPYRGRFIHSVAAALEGIVHTLQTERNMRIHFLVAFLVLIGGLYLNLNAVEFMLLCFAVAFVLVSEMVNTAVEHAIDLISDEFHPTAKIIKDIAAGAVFVSVINAVIVGYILFFRRLHLELKYGLDRLIRTPYHVTLIALITVVGLVLLIKVIRKEKYLLRGGMPSGHAAVAFAIWTAVSIMTGNSIISLLVLIMALLIARARLTEGVHSIWQIIVGAVMGFLVTLLAFQFLLP